MVDICGGTSLSAPVFASLLSELYLDLYCIFSANTDVPATQHE